MGYNTVRSSDRAGMLPWTSCRRQIADLANSLTVKTPASLTVGNFSETEYGVLHYLNLTETEGHTAYRLTML